MKYELYGGEITLQFNEKKHTYTRGGGIIVPSVTQILGIIDKSGPLRWWAARCAVDYVKAALQPGIALDEVEIDTLIEDAYRNHAKVSDKAKTIGTLAHSWIQEWTHGKDPIMPENQQAQHAIGGFLSWYEKHDITKMRPERVVYLDTMDRGEYAGTCDLVCEMDGIPTVIDYKTSKDCAIYPEWRFQLAAYAEAICCEDKLEDDLRRIVVVLDKENGTFRAEEFPEHEQEDDIQVFEAAMVIYNRLRELK